MKPGRSIYRQFTFVCPVGHIERSWQWNTTPNITCPTQGCTQKAEQLQSIQSRNAQGFKPPVIAHNPKTGEYRHLASEKARVPKGYERVELRTSTEINRALRQMDAADRRAYEQRLEREQAGREGFVDPYRDYRPKTEFGARLMEYAKEQDHRQFTPRWDSRNYLPCFEFSPGNLED